MVGDRAHALGHGLVLLMDKTQTACWMTTGGNWWRRYESSIIRSAYSHLLPGHPVIRTRPFEQLLDFIRRTSEEEQRAAREGLDEEELAIFDLLTKPEPTLAKAQEVNVKAIARHLLAKPKREKLILDWRLKENAKADVRQTIREEYAELPEVYDRRLWEDKVERTFQFMFERYAGEIAAPPG
jgi:hypothetical protein